MIKETLNFSAPGNDFILSSMDEIDDLSEHTWENVQVFIEVWKEWGRI